MSAEQSSSSTTQPFGVGRSGHGRSKRQPLSCLPCRRHKLRCDRCLPCGTCVRYKREEECRLNPPLVNKRRHRTQVALSSRSSQETFAAGSEPLATRKQQPGVGLEDFVNQLRQLCHVDVGSIPPATLPALLRQSFQQQAGRALWKTMPDSQHRNSIWKQQLSSTLPSRAQCDLLVNFYIDHINWIFQTLHVPSFRREYSQFWDNGADQGDFIWHSLLFTILSVSALYVPLEAVGVVGFPTESIRSLARVWHNASQHALRAGDYEAHPCIRQLQTFVITQLYWYATNQLGTLNSRLGQAVRCAQALCLDRDAMPSTCLRDEIRHRMWWELVDSDMFQTICLDRAPLIRLKHCHVPLPLNCSDNELTETSLSAKPMDVPSEIGLNICRARLFQLLNMRYHDDDDYDGSGSPYERLQYIDGKIEKLLKELPWYFQINERGQLPQLPGSLQEVLTWQHHILRTCVCTQRIRMYRPFLGACIGDARDKCISAAENAVVVYRCLRKDNAPTSWHKFLPQAYQIFSVAVTVAALLLVEGNIQIPNLYDAVKDMVEDLEILERHGCHVPVATQGRKVLLRLLTMIEKRTAGETSQDEAQTLVPQISGIMGGERTTRGYMSRLASGASHAGMAPVRTGATSNEARNHDLEMNTAVTRAGDALDVSWMSSLLDVSFDEMSGAFEFENMKDDGGKLTLFNWDMTGLLMNAQQGNSQMS